MKSLKLLNSLLTKRDKSYIAILFLLSVAISCIETLSVSALMLFIMIATNFSIIQTNKFCMWLYTLVGMRSPSDFVLFVGIVLIVFYICRALLNVAHIYAMSRFSYTRYHRFTNHLFTHFLNFPHSHFVHINSSVIGQAIFSHSGALTHFIFAILTFFAEGFTILCIYAMLFWVNWKMTVVLTCFLSVKVFIIIKAFSQCVAAAGKRTHKCSIESAKLFSESYGNFKLIKLSSSPRVVIDRFSAATLEQSNAQTLFVTLQNSPRFILETVGFLLLIGIVLYVMYRYHNASYVMPLVSMYALAFYRLLPSMNKILSTANQLTFYQHALQGIYDFLQAPVEHMGNEKIDFKHSIHLHNLSFEYVANKPVIQSVDIVMRKGERVGFIGLSGSGKSTLVDVIMGLYKPTHGAIVIDNKVLDDTCCRAWRGKVGYIPQTIYLFDGTVGQNVVFGRPYDEAKLIQCLKQAHIYDFLLTQQGLDTPVGDVGVKLSGGQKQRIAIARALYGDPELLVLDEATSALDHDTESCIMDEIYNISSDVTLVIIAHRTTTIARCDTIYKLEQGIVKPISHEEVIHHAKPQTIDSGA